MPKTSPRHIASPHRAAAPATVSGTPYITELPQHVLAPPTSQFDELSMLSHHEAR